MMRRLTVIVLALAQFSSLAQMPEATKVRTVCEVLTNLQQFRDKEINVRGVVYSSREIFALGGADCEGTLVTNGLSWPPALNLAESGYDQFSIGVNTDRAAMRSLMEDVRRVGSGKVWATVTGRLVAREEYRIGKLADGSLHGNGFGHLSAYPAQLVIRTVGDIQILNSTSK